MMTRIVSAVIVTLLAVFLVNSVQAQTVRAEGSALITEDGLVKARQVAIQDAMQQAALQAGARVESSSHIAESVLQSSSLKVRALGIIRNMVVLDEWVREDDDIYMVSIKADVEDHDPNQSRKNDSHNYRKKIAITQFRVSDRSQVHDMPNIEKNLAKYMGRLLKAENFMVQDASDYLLPESMGQYTAMGQAQGNVIVDFANRLGVQFIVTGVIHDMGVTQHAAWANVRHAEIEVIVLDGVSGTVVSRHRGNESTRDGRLFDFPTTSPTMNDKFFASPIGFKINKIAMNLVSKMSSDLHQLPFTARVLQAKGQRIQFDVGALSKVKVGDVLMAYRVSKDPTMNAMGQEFLGFEETPASTVIVKRVQPQFAIGELEGDAKSAQLQAGDVLRFGW